jgi:hypothetical protein
MLSMMRETGGDTRQLSHDPRAPNKVETQSMEAGKADHVWSWEEIAGLAN